MSDLPPDLERLRTLETWLTITLARVRRKIAQEEQQAAGMRRAQRLPIVPDWVLERGIGKGSPPVAVHMGGCHMAGGRVRKLERDQAVQAIHDGVEACRHCRPDTSLGLLD